MVNNDGGYLRHLLLGITPKEVAFLTWWSDLPLVECSITKGCDFFEPQSAEYF